MRVLARVERARWFRRALAALGAALAVGGEEPEAVAFAPTPLFEAALLGTGHATITENAILRVLSSDYGITQPAASVRSAIETIKSGNAFTDEDQFRSGKHFDGENFVGGHEVVIFERNQVLEFTRSGSLVLARFSLGEALHPLQDFYSHSNWIELGNGSPNAMLTRPGQTQASCWRRFNSGAACRRVLTKPLA